MFKYILLNIKKDIDKHRSLDTFKLVQLRLNKTFEAYVKQLEYSYSYLLKKDELKVLRQISKEAN